jgi:CheY-like chemotaxis protein
LLDNAHKFSPADGHIELSAAVSGGEVVIRVRDWVIGIDPAELTKLLEIYAQGRSLIGPAAQGFGIGLALVRQLTEMHGGTLSAASEGPGKGSEFVVRLPLAAAPSGATHRTSASPPISAEPKSSKRPILIVEDNPDAGEALASLMESEGHEVRVACDGTSGVALATDFKPAVAILDIGLPDMNGFELARRLREISPEVTLVAVSGWQIGADDRRAQEAGFKQYFTKPLHADRLIKLINEM